MTDDVKALIDEARAYCAEWADRSYASSDLDARASVLDASQYLITGDRLASCLHRLATALSAASSRPLPLAPPDQADPSNVVQSALRASAIAQADAQGYARGVEEAARVAMSWTTADHIAADMIAHVFPKQSPTNEAIAAAILALNQEQPK